MLTMQDGMNTRVHEQWIDQNFEWYRAAWIECGELIEHYGYKWWKKQDADIEREMDQAHTPSPHWPVN